MAIALKAAYSALAGSDAVKQDLPTVTSFRHFWLMLISLFALVPAACTPIPASSQQILAKPNMVFDDTESFAFSSRMLPQSEPGTAVSGSAPGGGCTACR